MPRVAWLTDIHLNFASLSAQAELRGALRRENPDLILISGDIAEAVDVADYLRQLHEALRCPLAFVLGNHDYYGSSIATVRRQMDALCREAPGLVYLSHSVPLPVTPHVAVVGHDGWADALLGDYEHSDVVLNDYFLIRELAGLGRRGIQKRLRELALQAAAHIARVLPAALETHDEVLLVTHVPPFRQACWYEGRPSDDNWLPHFSSKTMGDALREIMQAHPQRRLTVLCGHTHGGGEAQILDNLLVLTGGATYGQPAVQRVFEFEA